MVFLEIDDKPDIEWNKRLANSKQGTISQTSEYAHYVEKSLNYIPFFIIIYDTPNNIVGQLLIFKTKSNNNNFLKSIFKKILLRNKPIFQWVYGLIIFDLSLKEEIGKKLDEFFKNKNFRLSGSESPLMPKIFSGPLKYIQIKPWCTFLIDLTEDKDSIWKKIDKNSARKNIKRSQNREIKIKEITRDDLKYLHELRKDPINKVFSESLSDLEFHWDTLHSVGWTGFLAFKNEIPVGGITISNFNGYITEAGISRSTIDYENKFYSQDLLKWKIIEWGIEKKCRYFDLTGFNPNPKNDKEKGIFRYKAKWGGNLKHFSIIRR